MPDLEGACLGCRFAVSVGRAAASVVDGHDSWYPETEVPVDVDLGIWRLKAVSEGIAVINPDGRRTAPATPAAAQEYLRGEIELQAAAHTTAYSVIHAGVVARGGRALVLPGRSHAGKSTLTMALLRAGSTYYSDEYALLDPDGHVHPYRRRLRIREADAVQELDAQDLGAEVATGPAPVGLVAHLRYDSVRPVWDVVEMSPGDRALALIDNAVGATVAPTRVADDTIAASSAALGIRGRRDEATAAATRLLTMLGG